MRANVLEHIEIYGPTKDLVSDTTKWQPEFSCLASSSLRHFPHSLKLFVAPIFRYAFRYVTKLCVFYELMSRPLPLPKSSKNTVRWLQDGEKKLRAG